MRKRSLSLVLFSAFLLSCQSQMEGALTRAKKEAAAGRSQVANYLFSDIIENHKKKDEIRFGALEGLAGVYLSQLFDYQRGLLVLNKIFEEYGNRDAYFERVLPLRVSAAQVWRVHLENPNKALDALSPLLSREELSLEAEKELGKVYLLQRQFGLAEHRFKKAWKIAKESTDCLECRSLQLDIMQTYALNDRCGEALAWSKEDLPSQCPKKSFALTVEKAHCYEMTGDVNRAIQLFEEVVREEPDHGRAHFFLERLKKRRAEKQRK